MTPKKMVEYSFSVPENSWTSFSVNHTAGGTTYRIESESGRCDVATRRYDETVEGEEESV
ncbi:hypothetical protein GCM10010232_14090 [Streptomyces amakusaensis]|uniref:Uncharacterized protein n=1 Tax=Streptomyces amakusaensis TaxID=67271 RepID=A0ABW0AFB8_9ACTN